MFAAIGWFAVIAQYTLMIENRVAPVIETTVRFFSFFTILTNTLVAVYFSYVAVARKIAFLGWFDKPGSLTAITVYITIVGLVYQIVLRSIWEPAGLQMVVDELLHSVIPLCVILFWYRYESKSKLDWRSVPGWLIFPLVYLAYILSRGFFSGFYPYPFINVSELGMQKVALNSVILLGVFFLVSVIFIETGKRIERLR